MRHALDISDGHLGVRESDDITRALDAQSDLIQILADHCSGEIEVLIKGDLIAGPCQRGDADDPRAHRYPKNWEQLLIHQAPHLFTVLRKTQVPVTYIPGNSERREDFDTQVLERRFGPNINWTQNTGKHSYYDPERRMVVTHTNLAEPHLPLIKQCAPVELAGFISHRLRNLLYGRTIRSESWQHHIDTVSNRLSTSLAAGDDQRIVDQLAIDIDDEHKTSCLENERMDNGFKCVPGALAAKNLLAYRTLEGMYARTLAQARGLPEDTEIITGGHTHMPYIYNREELIRMMCDHTPSTNLKYVVNSGTMVPLTAAHGGDHRGHMIQYTGREPQLWQVYDAKKPDTKPVVTNIAGQRIS